MILAYYRGDAQCRWLSVWRHKPAQLTRFFSLEEMLLWLLVCPHYAQTCPSQKAYTSTTVCTLGIAFVTGLSYLLSLMFSVQDWSTLADSQTGLPLAEIFHQATQSRGGAFALVFLLWIAIGPCMIGSQLSMPPDLVGPSIQVLLPDKTILHRHGEDVLGFCS
jgi:hypothetical protein